MEQIQSLSSQSDPRQAMAGLATGIRRGRGRRLYCAITTATGGPGDYRIEQFQHGDAPPQPGDQVTRNGGFIGDLIRLPTPKLLQELTLIDDPVLADMAGPWRSAVACPLFVEGAARDWAILLDSEPDGVGIEELKELMVRVHLVCATIDNLRIAQQLCSANIRVQREISQIAALQQGLLPQRLPEIPGLKLASSYEPCGQAGGDLYDLVPLAACGPASDAADARWALLIGDVAGHGPAAAVVMAMLHSILQAYPHRPERPGQLLDYLNRQLCAKRIEAVMVTAFLAFYDPRTRQLTYASAGHNPPLLRNAEGGEGARWLDDVGDIPLGLYAEVAYEDGMVEMQPGQSLVMYTDGITEAADPAGTLFHTRGLEAALQHTTGEPNDIVQRVRTALLAHEDGAPPRDDQTLLVARVAD